MKTASFIAGLLVSSLGLVSAFAGSPRIDCGGAWKGCESLAFAGLKLRAGYLEESAAVPFRGNILYFEGLADSMRNHLPFFSRLAAEGYRVIAFDYRGQGGSAGRMDDTRIAEIPKIGKLAWDRFAREPAKFPQRTVIGWSTGGLAAYHAVAHGLADRVVLIAPGIVAKNVFVITEESLTSDRYSSKDANPHLDPISPRSPLLVPHFACDLLRTGYAARGLVLGRPCLSPVPITKPAKAGAWKIPAAVPGFVALSDPDDKYVDAAKTRPVLSANTGFEVAQYAGALHEIDNERAGIREKFFADVIAFLARTNR